ncbi:MAG: hypothetical protein ABR90_05005 [Cryomorphaceae bacterium BACL29 MAG-121220-bin8]|jgi:hypothetical protein|nr:MAG: hypothetical protein ABR90_05005 [Cryomorphaceae bacterium BACL29 MAG-121220-bin8]|tara:strand:+ start:9510 stop:10094 length:585 start_codon:yes stop_codon:yes gene_type:complete
MIPAYLAPISHWKQIIKGKIIWDHHQNFNKQTLRNRTFIHSANGLLKLTIPIKHSEEKFILKEALIENDYKWQQNHWKSIESAYRSSPFFMYYEDSLKEIYNKEYEKLIDINIDLTKLVYEWLEIKANIFLTDEYRNTYVKEKDLRFMTESKTRENQNIKEYTQVFSNKNGFINNLSIIDLIFNEGPNSINLLK